MTRAEESRIRSPGRPGVRAVGAVIAAAAGLLGAAPQAEAQVRFEATAPAAGLSWFRGNTHAHTLESDGDSPPETVARWYRDHGYSFLVLSDHNVLTDPAALSHLVDSTFLLIPGEEVSSSWQSRAVHVNGLNLSAVVAPATDSTLVGTLQKNVDGIRHADGVPHINHPNFQWAFGAEELARVRGDRLLEIFNGHPLVHNHGAAGSPGLEAIWDALLTGGKRIYGIAVDDAHHFQGEFAADRANPGRGWVAVRAARLEAATLMEALEAGHFYASTGVELEEVSAEGDALLVRIRPHQDYRYTTTFIGDGGRTLAVTADNPARYRLAGGEAYVRARIVDSGGRIAWVQPVFTMGGDRRPPPR